MGPRRVLLVDPLADDREYQAHVLRTAGFEVFEADGDGFAKALALRPDAIVIDVSPLRPGMLELVQALKGDARTSGFPLVVVSSYPRPDLVEPHEFLPKPCRPDELTGAVNRAAIGVPK